MRNILSSEHLTKSTIRIVITIITIAVYIFLIVAYILIVKKLCTMVKENTLKHNAEKIAIAIVITILVCWPAAIGQGIYVLLKWKETKVQPPAEQPPIIKAPYKDDYERWKEERLKEQQKKD